MVHSILQSIAVYSSILPTAYSCPTVYSYDLGPWSTLVQFSLWSSTRCMVHGPHSTVYFSAWSIFVYNPLQPLSVCLSLCPYVSPSHPALSIALRQYWTVSSCLTSPLISIMSIILDQSKPVQVNLHTIVPRFATSQLVLVLSTCNSLHANTQSLLSLRSTSNHKCFWLCRENN